MGSFEAKQEFYRSLINDRLDAIVSAGKDGAFREAPEALLKAMRYSLLSGGKRIRPMLMLAVVEMLSGDIEEALAPAAALEMIHTYSLIHDDLPGMDDDDYRRGRLTNHKVFGEGQAILAGDALLNGAYEVMLSNIRRFPEHVDRHILAMEAICRRAGVCGMIAGQCIDLLNEGIQPKADTLQYIHQHKTADLITAPLEAGGYISGADQKTLLALQRFGHAAGMAFQIDDDLLDIEGDAQTLGKETGMDAVRGKATWPALVGIEEAHEQSEAYWSEAKEALLIFGESASFLLQMTSQLSGRKK